MWLYLPGGLLLIVGIVGGILTGGIIAIALVPLGAILLLGAAAYSGWGRMARGRAGANAHPSVGAPLPHTETGDPSHVTTSPEALADARRTQQ